MRVGALLIAAAVLVGSLAARVVAQRRDVFVESRDHPAIAYSDTPGDNLVTALNRRLETGEARLTYDRVTGYLASVLAELRIPVESQALVFSPTSFQADTLSLHNPRALYFNDTAAVGWVRGGDILEVAVLDPRQSVHFYQLPQTPVDRPQLERNDQCLACHLSWDTYGVPGLFTMSMFPLPDDKNAYASGFTTSHGSPLEQRWGGWYVTGHHGGVQHMGNVKIDLSDPSPSVVTDGTLELASVEGLFDLEGYLSPYSDVVAQLVLAHQTHTTNLIARLGWEARVAAHDARPGSDAWSRVREAAQQLVDQLLFVDEIPLAAPVRGGSGFTERFSADGPVDGQGRSLRTLDLDRWLMRYPCSYMIYTDAFDALPPEALALVYERMSGVLSGTVTSDRYAARLSSADRRAVVEILRDTKPGLPADFGDTTPGRQAVRLRSWWTSR